MHKLYKAMKIKDIWRKIFYTGFMKTLIRLYIFVVFVIVSLNAFGIDFSIEDVRSIGMGGALRSSAYSTSAVLLNPGGISMAKLYHIDALYMYEHPFESHLVGASVVDSITSMVGVGIGYFYRKIRRSDVEMQVHDARLGISIPIANILGIGITGKYIYSDNEMKIDEDIQKPPYGRELNNFSLDAGLQLKLGKYLGLGVVGYNLTNIDTPVAPLSLGVSASGAFSSFLISADALLDWSSYGRLAVKVMGGMEYFLAGHFPLRIGYSYNDGRKAHSVSGGIGFISKTASIEAGISGDVNEPIGEEKDIRFIVSIKYFLY